MTPYDLGVSGAFRVMPAFDESGNLWFSTAESSLEILNADGSLTPTITGMLGFSPFYLTFGPDGILLLSQSWGGDGNALLITGFGSSLNTTTRSVPAVPAWAALLLALALIRVILHHPGVVSRRVNCHQVPFIP